jgi:hypothetical protein
MFMTCMMITYLNSPIKHELLFIWQHSTKHMTMNKASRLFNNKLLDNDNRVLLMILDYANNTLGSNVDQKRKTDDIPRDSAMPRTTLKSFNRKKNCFLFVFISNYLSCQIATNSSISARLQHCVNNINCFSFSSAFLSDMQPFLI